ncbi:MAG: hypothetical protein RL469_84, partial [Pseudomonadota bacterium]
PMTRGADRPTTDRRATLEALLLHAVIGGVLVGGFWTASREPPAPTQLAIEAVVVDARDVGAPPPATAPEGEAAPEAAAPVVQPEPVREPEPEPPPKKSLDEAKKAEAKAKAKAEAKAKADAKAKAEAKVKAEAKAKAEAEAKAKAEAKAQAEAKARESAKIEAERRKRTELEADLQRQIAAEERVANLRQSGLGVQWAAAIQARVQRAWIRPTSARSGLDCKVAVTQIPGGTVVAVKVLECNGDEVVRQSIEAAVYRASPLPAPPDPALFERNLELRFRPND